MIEAEDLHETRRHRLTRMRRWNLLTWILWVGYTHLLVLASMLLYARAGSVGSSVSIGFDPNGPRGAVAPGEVRLKIQSDRPASGVVVEVAGGVGDKEAQAGKDYKIRDSRLTLAPDSRSAAVIIEILDNPDRIDARLLRLNLKAESGVRVDPAWSSWTLLLDGKGTSADSLEVSFVKSTMKVEEGQKVTAKLSISPATHRAQTILYRVDSRDMLALPIPTNVTGADLLITLPDDEVYSGDRKVVVSLQESPGVRLGSPSTLELTVLDNDSKPTLRIAAGRLEVAEGSSQSLSFRLTLEGAAAPGEVSVACKVLRADSGLVMQKKPDPILRLQPRERERVVEIPVSDDKERNKDREFTLEFSDANGALFQPAKQTLTFKVQDDDGLDGRVLLVVIHNTDLQYSLQKIQPQLSQLLGVRRFQDAFLRKSVVVVRSGANATTWNPADPFPTDPGRPFRADEPIEDAINAALVEAKSIEREAIDRNFAVLILWPTRNKPGAIPFTPGNIRRLEGHPTRIRGLGTSLVEFAPLKAKFDQVFGTDTAKSYDAPDLDDLQDYLARIVTQFIEKPPGP